MTDTENQTYSDTDNTENNDVDSKKQKEIKRQDAILIKSLKDDINHYEQKAKTYHSICTDMWDKYAIGNNEENNKNSIHNYCKFAIFWSNVQTLKPALFAKLPKINISKRLSHSDVISGTMAQIAEQVADHYADTSNMLYAIKKAVLGRLVNGRGTVWFRYFTNADMNNFFEGIECDFVRVRDFGHSLAGEWTDVNRVWRKVYLTKQEAKNFFHFDNPIETKKIIATLKFSEDYNPYETDDDKDDKEKKRNCACVYEVWCKETKMVYFLDQNCDAILMRKNVSDTVNLTGFFPCPKPLYATLPENSLFPKPDYEFYKLQAEVLELLAQRQKILIEQIKIKGVYDQSHGELANLLTAENGKMTPIKDLPMILEKGGLNNLFAMFDVTNYVNQLTVVTQAMKEIKADIYEITGIADIIRGQGQSNVTATSDGIKAKFATLRLSDMQDDVQNFIKDAIVIMTEMALQVLGQNTIDNLVNVKEINDAKEKKDFVFLNQIIKNVKNINALNYKVDIETDSTVRIDQDAEKAERMEFVNVFGSLMSQAMQAPKELLPLTAQVLKFAIRSFRGARELETEINNAMDNLLAAGNNQNQPQPTPEQQAEQQRQQAEQQKQQADSAFKEKIKQMELQNENMIAKMKMNFDMQIQELKSKTGIDIENIRAMTDIDVENIRAMTRLNDDGRATYGQPL